MTLTNGGADQTGALLEAVGLDRYVERVLAPVTQDIGSPHPNGPSCRASGRGAPDRLGLVAAYGSGVHGARRAGLVIGWASRLEGSFSDMFEPAGVSGPDLVSVADRLLALPTTATT